MPTRGEQEADDRQREDLLDTLAALVFAYLSLSVQAITLPALSKAWKQWAQEKRAKERTLEQAEQAEGLTRVEYDEGYDTLVFYVPLWAAQQQQLSDEQTQIFQLRAVFYGDTAAADWFGVEADGPHDHHSNLCAWAAHGGHLEVLRWLQDRGCVPPWQEWDMRVCEAAAERGDLGMLQWARANGCPWDAYTCSYAAGGGPALYGRGSTRCGMACRLRTSTKICNYAVQKQMNE